MLKTMQTMISVKIDRSLKEEAHKTAQALGVSLSAVINQYIKEFVAARQVVFTDHPFPNKKTQKLLDKISADIAAGKNLIGPFDTAKEMIKYLDRIGGNK
jgi:addiction module RelB/DinJ family antitoxin